MVIDHSSKSIEKVFRTAKQSPSFNGMDARLIKVKVFRACLDAEVAEYAYGLPHNVKEGDEIDREGNRIQVTSN